MRADHKRDLVFGGQVEIRLNWNPLAMDDLIRFRLEQA